jgi:hypothetical protein
MKKYGIVFCSVLMFSILIIPLTINPIAQAVAQNTPSPIPGNLIPIPSTGSSIIPSIPNLGTVPITLPSTSLYSINKIQSGLVVSDSLTNETKTKSELQSNPRYWFYGGDAIAENAPYDFHKDAQGLHLGVQAPQNGTWAGIYAVAPSTKAALFHAVITTPVSTIPSTFNWYENGLYVQTTQPVVSYVTCTSLTSKFDTRWYVVATTGNANQSTTFTVLYGDTSPDQPLTRDCTIITNGDNYLKVYLDGVMVYSSNTLKLNMPGPFYAFLEPQSNYAGQFLEGTFKDYYAAADENIQVTNLPNNAVRVDLTDASGVLSSAPVSNGTAKLDIGKYHFPLVANIQVYDSNNVVITSTSTSIFGGDVYSVS